MADGAAKTNGKGLTDIYTEALTNSHWSVPQDFDVTFDWRYDQGRAAMMGLYQKGKEFQWDATVRIDWSQELDPENPQQLPDAMVPIAGMPLYEKMSAKEKALCRQHFQAWQVSQFMQGEQGALICAAKIVTQVPDADAKFYAATQVVDEARHVETYRMLLQKFGVAYQMTPPLKELIDQTLRDSRWDMTYLGMQVVIEGLALAAFQTTRDYAQNPLAQQVNAYVMQDESRHVAFGRLALRDYYPQLTQKERDEREEFLVEACFLMRDRFEAREVWRALGLPEEECVAYQQNSEIMKTFRNGLFMRIVPIVKDIGLWGPIVQEGYGKMGVLDFAKTDIEQLQKNDDTIARDLDARRKHVESVIADGRR
jgi:hypothetical protein